MRDLLLKSIREKPSTPWPPKFGMEKAPWCNFANKAKVLGSPMFDAAYFGDMSLLYRCLDCINLEWEKACNYLGTYWYDQQDRHNSS
jgi:hypothetical protein